MTSAGAGESTLVLDRSAPTASHVPTVSADIERHHERRHQIIRRALAGGDLVAVTAAALLAGAVAAGSAPASELALAVLMTLPVWLLVFKLYDLYERDAKRITHSTLDDLPRLFHAILVSSLLFWAYTELIQVHQVSVVELGVFSTSALVLVLALRVGVRRVVPRALGSENVLVAGDASTLAPLVARFRNNSKYGLVPVGRLTPATDGPVANRSFGPALDSVGDASSLARAAGRLDASRLVIDRPSFSSAEVLEMIETCRRLGVKVSILPGAVDALGPATELDEVEGITVLGLNPPVLGRTSRWLKRSFDVTVAGLLLLLACPFYPLVALAIKLDSRGPVLFRQTRVGRGDQRFMLLKLRTMVADAEERRAELLSASRDPNWLLLDTDPRVTRVGRFLRRTSLDEVPQLWNVIRGEMSLVGPRPLPEAEDARIGGWERTRLDLTPGITGLWQVLGRTSIPFAEMVKLDYVYVTNWSLWLDFKLLAQTLPTVLSRDGAN